MKSVLARDLRLNDVPLRDAPPPKAAPAIRIDKGIPLAPNLRAAKPCPYPFAAMEVGDSFAIPVPLGEQAKETSRLIRGYVASYRRQHPEFAGATRIESGGRSVRCWRVASPARCGRPRKAA